MNPATRITAALAVIGALAGCNTTLPMDACVDQNHGSYDAMHRCEIDVLRSEDPAMARVWEAYDKLFDARREVRDEAYKAAKEGRISEYEYQSTLCDLSRGHGCTEVHTITPDGDNSDVIVQVR